MTWPKSLTVLRFEVAGSEYSCFNSVVSDIGDFPRFSKNFLLHGSCRKAYMYAARCCSHWRFGSVSAFWNHPGPWRPTESGFSRAGARFTFMSLQKSDGRKKTFFPFAMKKTMFTSFTSYVGKPVFFAHHVWIGLMVQWSINSCRPGPGGFAASDFELRSCEVPSCQENQATPTPHPVVRLIQDINGKMESIFFSGRKNEGKKLPQSYWQISIKGVSHLMVSNLMPPPVSLQVEDPSQEVCNNIITTKLAVIYHSSTQVYRQVFINFNAADCCQTWFLLTGDFVHPYDEHGSHHAECHGRWGWRGTYAGVSVICFCREMCRRVWEMSKSMGKKERMKTS